MLTSTRGAQFSLPVPGALGLHRRQSGGLGSGSLSQHCQLGFAVADVRLQRLTCLLRRLRLRHQ